MACNVFAVATPTLKFGGMTSLGSLTLMKLTSSTGATRTTYLITTYRKPAITIAKFISNNNYIILSFYNRNKGPIINLYSTMYLEHNQLVLVYNINNKPS